MANITGKDGYVTKQVSGVDTLIAGLQSWTINYSADLVDTTSFAIGGVTHKTFLSVLQASEGSFSGNITDTDVGLTPGSSYNLMLVADDNRAYYGSAYIKSNEPNVDVSGVAGITYSFQFTGKVYVLSEDVVVDGDFTAASGAAWSLTGGGTYDTTGDQLDFDAAGTATPASNDVITSAKKYWTQIKIEGESGTSTCQLTVGDVALTSRTANGTYTEVMTSNTSAVTFSVAVTTDDALSISEIIIRQILN